MTHLLSEFEFYKNTPFTNLLNTVHFNSNSERDAFFNTMYQRVNYPHGTPYHNFVRDRHVLNTDISYADMRGVNYCRFYDSRDDILYYAFVTEYRYINERTTAVQLLIDGVMTFTQGDVLNNLERLTVTRQHLTQSTYNAKLWEIKNNNDVIECNTKSYFHEDGLYFKDYKLIIQSSADLTTEFGTINNPVYITSTGATIDKITSPLDLYVVDNTHVKEFTTKLSLYPWIAQNIQRMYIMPEYFLNDDDIEPVSTEFDFNHLYKIKDNTITATDTIDGELDDVSKTLNELMQLYDLDPAQDRHLLRNHYFTLEMYTYDGKQLDVDISQLNDVAGFKLEVDTMIGFENEITFYIKDYRIENKSLTYTEHANLNDRTGAYINDALIFNNFDSVPMLVDNFGLGMAKGANVRALQEERKLSSRMGNIFGTEASVSTRLYDALSIIGGNLSLNGIGNMITDEYEYYRDLQAQEKDMALLTPSINGQVSSYSHRIKNDVYGINIKYSKPSLHELNEIKKYYKLFGYDVRENNAQLDDVTSMSIMNYVQFDGNYNFNNVDVTIVKMLKEQFKNGVKLWHNNNTPNPMNRNIMLNEMVM